MALNTGKILMRRGQEVNFDPNKMMPGEWAVSLDSKYVRMCFSPGVCVRMATYDAFEADMVQIQRILAECQTVEEAVQRIYEEIKDVAVDVERIETAAASALESEENALNSANLAVQSAETAMQKAEEAEESANIASTKAEQATEGANTAIQKASEAAESAGNVRDMSEVSQSYAVGGTGTREGEDTDNAKYYNQQASDNADRAEEAAERASAVADVGVATTEKAGLVKPDGETIRVEPDGTIHADRGTTSYTDLENKPKINDVELDGDKTLDELGIASKDALEETDNKVNIIIENAELRFKETASGENIHLDDSADSKLVEFGLYGKAVQNGIPTPQNPVDIEVAGIGGSVKVKSCGKNLLKNTATSQTINGVTFTVNEDKSITANGTATAKATFLFANKRINNITPILGKEVIISGSIDVNKAYVQFYDAKNKIGRKETTFIMPTDINDYEWNCICEVTSGTTVSGTFYPMIRLASDADATYEAYKETLSTITTQNGLAGIPVSSGGNYTDESGQQWICDEIIKYADGSGEHVKRVENSVNNNLVLEKHGYSNDNYLVVAIKNVNSSSKECISTHLISTMVDTDLKNKACIFVYEGTIHLSVPTTIANNVDTLKTWLLDNNVKIYYALATPIRTPLTAEQIAEIEKLHTFYPVTNISNDFDCGMKVKYIADAKSYIDNRLALIEQAMLNSI